MSTLQEHVQALRAIAQKESSDAKNSEFAFHANLTLGAHLEEVAALLDAVAKPAACAGRLIAGIWQCGHCDYFDLAPPGCAHKAADAQDAARYRWRAPAIWTRLISAECSPAVRRRTSC